MADNTQLSRSGLELLVEAARALLEESDLNRMLSKLLDKAFEVGGAERGYVLLRDRDGNMTPAISRGIEPGSLPPGDPSRSIVETALKERRPVLSRNASRDPRFSGAESLILRGIRSACCIPLEARSERLGALYIDATTGGRLNDDELPLLEAFGSLAALSLARALELDDVRKAAWAVNAAPRYEGMMGESPAMQRLYDHIDRMAAADLPVIITGESGTGKELIARALHRHGRRKDGPFRAIFCGNLTSDLLESELFGYKKGAFTGAVADKPGLLDLADKGTLFLDEIADIPMSIQAKLLRFLQDGEYQRLGDPHPRRADARILSATNKSLEVEIAAARFRADLFYRLNVLAIESPPLRDREGDIPLLAAFILTKVASRTGHPQRRISRAALSKLSKYTWKGNVRELENVLARSAVLAAGEVIEPEDIDLPDDTQCEDADLPQDNLDLQSVIESHLLRVLKMTSGNRSEAARLLGVSRRYIQKTLVKWNED